MKKFIILTFIFFSTASSWAVSPNEVLETGQIFEEYGHSLDELTSLISRYGDENWLFVNFLHKSVKCAKEQSVEPEQFQFFIRRLGNFSLSWYEQFNKIFVANPQLKKSKDELASEFQSKAFEAGRGWFAIRLSVEMPATTNCFIKKVDVNLK